MMNMVRPIMKDIFFLNQKSEPATVYIMELDFFYGEEYAWKLGTMRL
jgi:hypothetical protein